MYRSGLDIQSLSKVTALGGLGTLNIIEYGEFGLTVLRDEINVTNWTDFEVPWYLINKMENSGQSGPLIAMPYYSLQGLFGVFSFLTSHPNGILPVTVVTIGRISVRAESG
jgi:hypothetical protein